MLTPRTLLCALVLGTSLAACGSTPAPGDESVHTPSEHGSYAHCLAEHGIEQPPAPGPAAPPAGVDPLSWEQAMQACAELAPGPGPHG